MFGTKRVGRGRLETFLTQGTVKRTEPCGGSRTLQHSRLKNVFEHKGVLFCKEPPLPPHHLLTCFHPTLSSSFQSRCISVLKPSLPKRNNSSLFAPAAETTAG